MEFCSLESYHIRYLVPEVNYVFDSVFKLSKCVSSYCSTEIIKGVT